MNRGKSVYGIRRVDNDLTHTHSWLVTIQRRGVIYRRHFSDGRHGGKRKALAAATEYRDAIIEKHPPLSIQEYSNIIKRNNRSGIVGVCRYCTSETRGLPPEKQRWFWMASYRLPSGKRQRVKFSVKKYSEEGAFGMALKAREQALKKLEGSFEPAAVRRRPARRRAKGDGSVLSAG